MSAARYQPPLIPITVGLPLAVVAAVFGIRFMVVEARFASIIAQTGKAGAVPVAHVDGKRSGSFAEGEVSATVEVVVDGGSIQSPA